MTDQQIEEIIDALMHVKGCDEMREILAPLLADKRRMDWLEVNLLEITSSDQFQMSALLRLNRSAIDEAMGSNGATV